jgi:hypothetical protein
MDARRPGFKVSDTIAMKLISLCNAHCSLESTDATMRHRVYRDVQSVSSTSVSWSRAGCERRSIRLSCPISLLDIVQVCRVKPYKLVDDRFLPLTLFRILLH